jgi:ribosomal-protein-alanine N-acetyltransferase
MDVEREIAVLDSAPEVRYTRGHEGEKMKLYQSARVILRRLTAEDRDEFVRLVRVSSELLQPWVNLPTNPADFDQYLQRFDGHANECTLICVRESSVIAGTVSLSNIMYGSYQRATVGYNAFLPSVRQGFMLAGFELVFQLAFEDLGLHRLEADIQPGNEASLQFAKKAGFRREGYSPDFICINGVWRDHERWAVNREMVELKEPRHEESEELG